MRGELGPWLLTYRVTLIFAGIGSVLVPIIYAWVSEGQWKNSSLGKHLMGSDATIAAMFVFYVVATLTDSPRVELFIGSTLFVLFGVLRLMRSRFMLHARKVRKDQEKYHLLEEEPK